MLALTKAPLQLLLDRVSKYAFKPSFNGISGRHPGREGSAVLTFMISF